MARSRAPPSVLPCCAALCSPPPSRVAGRPGQGRFGGAGRRARGDGADYEDSKRLLQRRTGLGPTRAAAAAARGLQPARSERDRSVRATSAALAVARCGRSDGLESAPLENDAEVLDVGEAGAEARLGVVRDAVAAARRGRQEEGGRGQEASQAWVAEEEGEGAGALSDPLTLRLCTPTAPPQQISPFSLISYNNVIPKEKNTQN